MFSSPWLTWTERQFWILPERLRQGQQGMNINKQPGSKNKQVFIDQIKFFKLPKIFLSYFSIHCWWQRPGYSAAVWELRASPLSSPPLWSAMWSLKYSGLDDQRYLEGIPIYRSDWQAGLWFHSVAESWQPDGACSACGALIRSIWTELYPGDRGESAVNVAVYHRLPQSFIRKKSWKL